MEIITNIQEDWTPRFSYFDSPIRNIRPSGSLSLPEVYEKIRNGSLKTITETLRSLPDAGQQRRYKASHFPYVTFSGIFGSRKDSALLEESNLIVIDLDKLSELEATRRDLLQAPFDTELLFVSPSGHGLKWVLRKGSHPHLKFFQGICKYLKINFGIEADFSGKDLSRACFLGDDPEIYLNPKYSGEVRGQRAEGRGQNYNITINHLTTKFYEQLF